MNRRGFLQAILAATVAPAVVKAASLMPIRATDSGILVMDLEMVEVDLVTPTAWVYFRDTIYVYGRGGIISNSEVCDPYKWGIPATVHPSARALD